MASGGWVSRSAASLAAIVLGLLGGTALAWRAHRRGQARKLASDDTNGCAHREMLDDGVATSLHSPDAQAPTPIASAAIQVSETELGFPETPLDMRTTPTPTTPSDFAMLVHANEALQEEVDRVYTAAVEADRRGQEAREELARTTTEARDRLNAEIAAREALIETAEHRAEEVRQLRHARDTERLKGEVSLGVQSEAYLRDVNVLETRVHDLACELAASRMFHAARFRTLRASVDAWSARLVTARHTRFVRRHAACASG